MGRDSTRLAAKLTSAAGISSRQAAKMQPGITKITYERTANASWSSPRPDHKLIRDFLCERILPVELANEYGEWVSSHDASYAALWLELFRQRRVQEQLQARGERSLVEEHLAMMKGFTDQALADTNPSSLMQIVTQAASLTHLAQNEGDKSHRDDLCLRAEDLIETRVVDSIGDDYSGFDVLDVIPKVDDADQKPWLSHPSADLTGILLSASLEYGNQLVFLGGRANWRSFVIDLDSKGLLCSLAVRGLVCSDPDSMLNAAEALFEANHAAASAALIQHAYQIDDEFPSLIKDWSSGFDQSFLDFANHTLEIQS